MANPRQRSKARSHKSTKPSQAIKRRLHHKLRKAPPLKGPEVLQRGWDRNKTVFQNYAALGLLPSIPIPKGPSSSRSHRARVQISQAAEDSAKVSYGRILRDEEGNVVDIIIPDEDDAAGGRGVDEELDENERVEGKTDIVRTLEELSNSSAPVKRYSSTSERTWLHSLVEKYRDDTAAMARDRGLNVWQKTGGEIERMIRKAGGGEKLQGR